MKTCPKAFRLVLALCTWVLLLFLPGVARAQDVESGPASDTSPSDASLQGETAPDAPSADSSAEENSPASPDSAAGGRIGPDYLIGPEDVLSIEVFNIPELKQTVRVENDGTISLPLLGHVQAAGLTPAQLRQELESKWDETYLEDPQVSVFLKEFHSQPVSVIGAVEKPGLYALAGQRTLIEMLSLAGGAKRGSGAAGRTVLVTRRAGFDALQPVAGMRLVAPDQVEVDLRQLLFSHESALNLEIKPRDTITVSQAGVVYVVGAVKKPGGFTLEDREYVTVLQALALAEGLGLNAKKSAGRIIRRSKDGSLTEIPIDVGKVLGGRSRDVELAKNDILFVPSSAAKYAGRRSAESVIGTLSGLIIFRGL